MIKCVVEVWRKTWESRGDKIVLSGEVIREGKNRPKKKKKRKNGVGEYLSKERPGGRRPWESGSYTSKES